MKILYLSQRFPYPPNRGDRIPTFNHIRYLKLRGHEVHVASLLQDESERRHVGEMRAWAASCHVELLTRWQSFWGKLRAFWQGRPLSLGHYSSARLQAKVDRAVSELGIEAVVVFSSSMAQYVENRPELLRIMNFCDLDSQKWDELSRLALWPKRWVYRREARLLLAYEKKIAAGFNGNCVVTENEAAVFRRLIPGAPVQVVPNGVDHEFFGDVDHKPSGLQFAFVGVMDYEPNIEAATYFVREVWPLVLRAHPEARFNVVGARPVRAVQALAQTAGVTVTGPVPDVRPYLASATLVIVPLGVARGIQNKVLEAMAAGVPVLTTTAAAAGFPAQARACLNICDRDPETMAARISALIADGEALRARAQRAQHYVRQNVSWEASGESLESLLIPGMVPAPRPVAVRSKQSVA